MRIIFFSLLAALMLFSCESDYDNTIDDERIIGTWHRYSFTEAGVETPESDSIVYHFLNDGRMIIKYYSDQGASLPDENYQYDLLNGILRYWNADLNVSEENEVFISGNNLRIKVYQTYFYNLSKLF